MAELKLGLKALAAGVEKIPDEYWEKIPAFRPKERDRPPPHNDSRIGREDRRRRNSDRPKPRRNSTGSHLAVGAAGLGAAGAAYEAERNHKKNKDQQQQQQQQQRQDQDSGYDSNNNNNNNYNYYNSNRDSSDNYNPHNQYQPPQQDSAMQDQNYNSYQPPRDGYDQNYQGGRPTSQYERQSGYQPNQYVPPGYGQGDLTKRPSSAGRYDRDERVSRYQEEDYSDDDSRSRHRDRKDSRRARSPSMEGMRGKLSKNFDLSQKGLGYSVLGAIAGGFIGHEVGKGPLATGVGAVIGGLGANVLEAREERHKLNARREAKYAGRRSRSEGRHGRSSYDDESNSSYYKDSYYNNGRGDVGSDEEYYDRKDRRSSSRR